MNTVVNSSVDVNTCVKVNSSVVINDYVNYVEMCNKCLELEAELIKQHNMVEKDEYNRLSKRFSELEQHCISLEIAMQLNKEIFPKNKTSVNQIEPSFDQLFELNNLKAEFQAKDTTIEKLKTNIKRLNKTSTTNNTYKQLYDSINPLRVRAKEQTESLINQLNQKSVEITDLNAQLQETKLDLVILAPKVKNNREAHEYYLKYTIEKADILREVVEQAKSRNPLDSASYSACNTKNDRISQTPSSNEKNKVEVQSRKVKSSLNKRKSNSKDVCNEHVKHPVKGVDLLLGSRGTNLYSLSIGDMMASSPICLLSKATKTKLWLWHRRLSHLNFGAINHLARHGLVRSLPRLKFEKDHLCSACAMGKSNKQSHIPKSKDTNQEKLYLLHMDLCGHMRVASVNRKKYILVIVDDYSRFTWVKFFASKDEAPDFIIKFLKMIQVILNETIRNIRTDNRNEFVNQTLQNCTLVEAARTMSIFAQAPLFLRAEAIATACYTQNRSIIRRRHGKTPYELLHDRKPYLSYLHVFGSLCYPNNDSENLGKLQAKDDIGLVPNPPPSAPLVTPSRHEWDLVFQQCLMSSSLLQLALPLQFL
ncbi:retrovirus-related pol polyprotein from transposon TNT 1-94 [Tanacetum coccineum]